MEDRRLYCGGSDVSAICNMNRWRSPLMVFMEKTSPTEIEGINSLQADLGLELENFLARRYEKETGEKIRRMFDTVRSKTLPSYMACHPDGRILKKETLVEMKTTTAYKEAEWEGEDLPIEYLMQGMWNLGITGEQEIVFIYLIGNHKFGYKTIKRDDEMIKTMQEKVADFWTNYVLPKVMPEPTFLDGDILQELYGITPKNETIIEVGDEVDETFIKLKEVKSGIKELEKEQKEYENKLKVLIGENTGIKTNKYQLKWTEVPETPIEAYTRKGYRKLSL
jgi:predicted phage-related endonuclease